jgi:hypothetical protein
MPVHVRQPDIEEDGVKPLLVHDAEGGRSTIALQAEKLGVEFQLFGKRLAERRVVIDNEDRAKSAHAAPDPKPPPDAFAGGAQPLSALSAIAAHSSPNTLVRR